MGKLEENRLSGYCVKCLNTKQKCDCRLNLHFVINCKHENELTKQGDGFTYVVCKDCGEDLWFITATAMNWSRITNDWFKEITLTTAFIYSHC